MILSLFLPERIGSYYLGRSRRVGIEITDRSIYATVIYRTGRSTTIEAIYQEKIVLDSAVPFDERVVTALRSLSHKLGTYDYLTCALPSSQVLFKTISLPFIGSQKIKMVVPFEAEPLLPFPLEQGILDSIITKEDTAQQTTHLIIVALKKEGIERLERLFKDAGVKLDRVSVDILDLYGLAQTAHIGSPENNVSALINFGATQTTLALSVQGTLSYIRTFPQGLNRVVPSQKDTSQGEFIADAQTEKQLDLILENLTQTIEATLPKLAPNKLLQEITVTGLGADLPNIQERVSQSMHAPVTIMNEQTLKESRLLTSKVSAVPGAWSSSIAAAAPTTLTEDFTLLRDKAEQEESHRLTVQLITLATLTALVFVSFACYSFWRIRTLKKAYAAAENEAISELKKQFTLRPQQLLRLEFANKAADADLKKQETAWRRISPDNRYAYLKYLRGLTRCINMTESQLQLSSIIMKDDTIKLYGSVPGYPQLNKLQSQLECPLFKKVPKLQDKTFMSEPITLIINPEEL